MFRFVLASLLLGAAGSPAVASQSPTSPARRLPADCAANVEVYYDEHKIPHIYSDSDAGAFYGLGYLQVRDFPINALTNLWSSNGRSAEALGQTALVHDRKIRHWELSDIAQAQIVAMDPEIKGLLDAFVAGVEEGRKWWRSHPAAIAQLIDLVDVDGTMYTRMHVNPLPDFLNESLGATDVVAKVEWLLGDDPAAVITLEHLVCLGIALNSGVGRNTFGLYNGGFVAGTNAWAISRAATTDGSLLTLSDSHVPLNSGGLRHFFASIEGPTFQAAGWIAAGHVGVTYGYNDHVSWLGSAFPGRAPNVDPFDRLVATDLPVKFLGNAPVVANTWKVDLESGSSTSFLYDGSPVSLETEQATLKYRDFSVDPPALVDDPSGATEWYWAPADTESAGARRYPVIDPPYQLPAAGSNISFAQSFFTRDTYSLWEYYIRLGRARNASSDVDDLLGDIMFNFGRGLNFFFADRTGLMRYVAMTKVPIQGDGAKNQLPRAPWLETDEADQWLDGSRSDYRWTGFHPYTDLPGFSRSIGPAGLEEVWICNVSSADLVDSAATIDPSTFPDYIIEHATYGTRAHRRERELLLPPAQTSSLTQEASEEFAVDKKDTWASTLWPLFKEAASSVEPSHTARVDAMIAFIDANKNEGEFDGPAGDEFVAHRTSSVMAYMMLLQADYEREIVRVAGLTDDQACLGFDAFSDPPPPASFTGPTWQPNIDVMADALAAVAIVHDNGTGPGGFDNQPLLAFWNAALTGPGVVTQMPWSHARYNDPGVTRWGHVNVMVLTPHFIEPFAVPEDLPDPGPALNFLRDSFLVSFHSGIFPPYLSTLDQAGLVPGVPDILPVLTDQAPALYPVGGTDNTVFPTGHFGYRRYEQAQQPWGSNSNSVFFVPHTTGSKVLLSVKLRDGMPAVGRFLAALGSTEISTAIAVNGTGPLDHYATSQDFVDSQWNDLRTDKAFHAANGQPRHCLTYDP